MKTTQVKFTRNPQYTPVSLSPRLLSRIERLCKAAFDRCYRDGKGGDAGFPLISGKEAVADRTNKWFSPAWATDPDGGRNCQEVPARKERHSHMMLWLSTNPDAQRYYSNCWNYLMAVAKRNGEVTEPTRYSRQAWAEIRGSY
jgi:hypothetical protein